MVAEEGLSKSATLLLCYSEDRSIQFNFNRLKNGGNRTFYGHWVQPCIFE